MVRKKVELKQERKRLVRAGKFAEADKKLEEYWSLCGSKKKVSDPPKKYTKAELEAKSFSELRKIGYRVGTKGRGHAELVREILELQ